ncbi:MAG TPA: apolipoprotein N-acyltransferase [Acidimicrobiales bacterium]
MPEARPTGWRAAGPLRHRTAYRRLLAGQAAGQLADGLAQIAFAQVVLFEVGQGATPWEIAKLLAATLLPYSLVGPFAGVVIDRYDRRRVMVAVSLFRAALVTAAVSALALDSQALAYAAVLLLLSSSRFVLAAKGAALPNTVGGEDLVTANAVSALAGMTAAFAGAVGGSAFVAAVPALGLVLAGAAYLAAARAFHGLPPVGGGGATERLAHGLGRVAGELVDGLAFAARRRAVRQPLLAVAGNRLLLGAGFILLVLVADERYGLEAPGYGLALAVTGVGAFAGTWLAPVLGARCDRRTLLPLTFLVGAAAASAGAYSATLAVLVTGVGAAAFAFQVLKVLVDALLQQACPDGVRGRVFSVHDLLYNVAFVAAGLALVPLWSPGRERALLWALAVGFVAAGAVLARRLGTWPFERAPAPRRRVPRRWAGRGLALAVGALPALAFPATDVWPLGAVGLVPLLALVVRSPTGREAVVRTVAGGAGFFAAAHHWLLPTTGPFVVLLGLALGVLWVPWGWLAYRLLRGRPSPGALVAAAVLAPAAWVVAEYLRSWEHLGGPWALLGATLWSRPGLAAAASLGGVWLLGLVLGAVNVAATGAVLPGARRATRVAGAAVAAGLLVGLWGYGALRPSPEPVGSFAVAGVQPGVVHRGAERFAAHEALTRRLAGQRLDLVVWAESSVGFDLDDEPGYRERLRALATEVGAPILVNVDARRGAGGIYKSSVLVEEGGIAGRYDKMRLVPFGEYIPLRPVLGWMASITEAAGEDRRRGDDLAVLDVGGVGIGPLVCFESAFPDLPRHLAERGAEVVVLQTATTTFQGSWAQGQHAGLGAIRAIESGRPMVHAAVSGVSAVYDAEGRRLTRLGNHDTGVWTAEVPLVGGRTPYVRAGDWVPVACVLALLAGAVVAGLRAARLPAAPAARPPAAGTRLGEAVPRGPGEGDQGRPEPAAPVSPATSRDPGRSAR